ncbi:MAG: hypothetical protein ABSD62_02845 [Candidatus Limnocylindrales bacterium]|jgi:hypothetical protein
MIAPDAAAGLRAERRFDLLAAVLIGAIAMLAAVLAVIQIGSGQTSGRAQIEAARLTADLTARLEVSAMAQNEAVVEQQGALALSLQGVGRQIAGLQYTDDGAGAIGETERQAATDLAAALAATSATSGGSPLDSYTSGLVKATTQQLWAEVNEQNRQVDIANDASGRNSRSILGLSFLALAGVLTGLAAVLREGRAGWFALLFAGAMAGAAGALAVWAVI